MPGSLWQLIGVVSLVLLSVMELLSASKFRLLSMATGMFLMIDGGWLLSMWTYNDVLFGFVYGL